MVNKGITTIFAMALMLAAGPLWAEPAEPAAEEAAEPAEEEPAEEAAEPEPSSGEAAPSEEPTPADPPEAAPEAAPEEEEETADALGQNAGTLEPVEEAPGETHLQVTEAEEEYVPSSVETAVVMGSLYTGSVMILSVPAFLPGGGNWMGAIHLGLAGCAAYFPEQMGWKFIGGSTFTTLAALNFLMNARGVSGTDMYTTNLGVALGLPLLLAGAYFGFEVWGESEPVADAIENPTEPTSEPLVEEPSEPEASISWNIVPMGDGAMTSLTLQF